MHSALLSTWYDIAALPHMMQHAHITHIYSNATKDDRMTTALLGAIAVDVDSAGKHHVNTSTLERRHSPFAVVVRHKDASASAYAANWLAVCASCREFAFSDPNNAAIATSRRSCKRFAVSDT